MNAMQSYDLISSSSEVPLPDAAPPTFSAFFTVIQFNHNRLRVKLPNYASVYRKTILFG
jgi:hypothetical protein